MIEQVSAEDFARTLPFYRAFRQRVAGPYPRLFVHGKGEDHYLTAWPALIRMGLGAAFIGVDAGADRGLLLATVTPDLFDGAPVATEHAWFVLPETRRGLGAELLDEYESWARARGAVRLALSHFLEEGMPNMEPYFRRRGFVPLEAHYLKAVA